MHIEPNIDRQLLRDEMVYSRRMDAAEQEFEAWWQNLSQETIDVLVAFEDGGLDVWGAFWTAREAGRL